MEQTLKRRNISGIYIFDTFPEEDHRRPTCIEDCRQEKRREWMATKNGTFLRNVIMELAGSFKNLTAYCHEEKAITDEYKDGFFRMADSWVEQAKLNWTVQELADQIDMICGKIVLLADAVGVMRNHPQDNDDGQTEK